MEENQHPLNPYLAKILNNLAQNQRQPDSSTTYNGSSTLAACDLANLDCRVCNNNGYVTRTDENGCQWARECECMNQRRSIRRINGSGLQDMVKRYSFENYETPTEKHKLIKEKAIQFTRIPVECFVIVGRSGSGKTHICTAICNELMSGGWNLKYMMWRTEAAELKAMVNEREEYKRRINQLRNVPVLYIDDFWKGTVTDADINLAFTILNDRYNMKNKKTIISTEMSMEKILEKDEAIGGRISERAKGFVLQAPDENWRLKDRYD